ncbi:uncharacterized protein LOC121405436 [Drosophila obscura]|uniref:uncharacterized protein LOC121405436 n=1 Tax=Drosophila obscura TaxID=7282 RepID=UPI001BB15425|nr:uncharacterized protein LOC121405436 [Drosophila obscura]
MEDFKLVKSARSRAKASITRLLTASQDPRAGSNLELEQITVLLERLNTVWKEFETLSDKMALFDEEEGYVDPAIDNETYEDKYLRANTLLHSLKRACMLRENEGGNIASGNHNDSESPWGSQASGSGNENFVRFLQQQQELNERLAQQQTTFLSANSTANRVQSELPKIHIKQFNGDYKEWPAFMNLFESTIHSNQHLTAIQKLHYLKTYVIGEAADLIRHMPITEAAYTAAWTCLTERYNRPRHIVNTLLDTFVNLPSTSRADVSILRKVTDGATEIVRGLDAAGQTNRDCWIIHFMLAKIDAETRRKWIEGSRELESPTVNDLLKFLDRRCEEFELSKSETDTDFKAAATRAQPRSDEQRILSTPEEATVAISHVARAQVTPRAEPSYNGSATATKPHGLRKSALPTALVFVRNAKGSHTICRVLLDSGSELSYISERCIQALGLSRFPSRILVSGISSIKAETTRGCSTLDMQSRISEHTMKVRAHVLSKITSTLARHDIDAAALRAFDGFDLADSEYQSLAPVDILLGSDYVWTVFTGQKMFDSHGNVIAISTIFGWVITSITTSNSSSTMTMHTAIDIDASLRRFWELEDVNQEFQREPEDDEVEQHFMKTHTRDSKGRYIVELPFKDPNQQFSDTLHGALARFRGVERRLERDPDLHAQYVQFMRDYLNLGHMRELSPEDIDKKPCFYLPHHPVITQKLRVVFDGSFKDTSGKALNDALHIGPSILRNLFSICIRFRMFKFVFSADIVKMYRQIWVAVNHCSYQRIVWREDESTPIKHYELSTVTYGTSSAPFLAVRVLDQLAHDHQHEFPTAAKILKEEFYMDDVLTGAYTEEELICKRDELIQLMERAGMELGKWVSNSSRIFVGTLTSTNTPGKGLHSTAKVLGIHWDPEKDNLSYNVCLSSNPDSNKRQVLSDVARIFDPLGILSPVVVQFKIMFQELWLLDLDWDTELPPKIADWWKKCRNDLNVLQELRLPRFVDNKEDRIELHGFSDASIKAYAAVVYSRLVQANGTVSVSLIAGKTRVAPLKQQSLPRLELCGALLLSRLIVSIKAALQHKNIDIHAWCDSTIVLAWLSQQPSKLKTFVANRTSEILDAIPRNAWHHVNTKENPADCASRGMLAAELLNFDLWWMGPSWLQDPEKLAVKLSSTKFCSSLSENYGNEEVKTTALTTQEDDSFSPLEALVQRVSSWTKLVRIVAYVLRFIQGTRAPKSGMLASSKMLKFEEIQAARILCLQTAQECFKEDRILLLENKPLRSRSQLLKLSPIVCKNGLLRVGGRLSNSQLPADVKHPILLPKSHRITILILEHEHASNLHPGVSALFVIMRQKYWIFGARNLIRNLVHNCIRCFRQRNHTEHQFMADLPGIRITEALPFQHSGCDYAGPFILKERRGRNPRKTKGYICLFVCLVTSAIHLELAADLSTDTFLACLRRFMSLRGKCSQIFSDNGTNFVGAKRALDEMQQLLSSQEHQHTVAQSLANDGIKWSFIPPHSPHWGGKWESSVRSVKLHLRRVVGKTTLTFEQMQTLIVQISAVVNSRPLCYTPDTDLTYLSPAHFLIGRPFTTIPEGDLSHLPINRLDYWQHLQAMYQGFWKRWHQEYLTSLQQRHKWNNKQRNISVDNVVLVKDSNLPPAAWILARVLEAHPGPDGLVRAVKLKTSTGEMTRPISKLAVLPNSETMFQGGPGC